MEDKELLERLIDEQAEQIIKQNNNYIIIIASQVSKNEEMKKDIGKLISHKVFKKMARELGFNI